MTKIDKPETCWMCAKNPSARDDWPLCRAHWNWWLANYVGTDRAPDRTPPARRAHLIQPAEVTG